jgi:hypothetical protein
MYWPVLCQPEQLLSKSQLGTLLLVGNGGADVGAGVGGAAQPLEAFKLSQVGPAVLLVCLSMHSL